MNFVIYSNKEYEKYTEAFLLSRRYSNNDDIRVLYYTIDFDSSLDYPNLEKIRWNINPKYPKLNYYKPEIIIDALSRYDNVCYMDTDILLGKRFNVNSIINESFVHPICCRGPLEYVWKWKVIDGETVRMEIENLMKYLNITERTSGYMWTSMISCNKSNLDFLNEWKQLIEDEQLMNDEDFYFPFQDETAFNALFWKNNYNHTFDLIFFNTGKYESFLKVETEESFSKDVREYHELYTKNNDIYETCNNSSKVQFYHGVKEWREIEKILSFMKTNYKEKRLIKKNVDRITLLKESIPNHGKGVEIGVFRGLFSKEILDSWSGQLYMIDPWRPLGSDYNDMSNHSLNQGVYETAMSNIKGYEDRAIMIRALSSQAVEIFKDESLDFVYIDGNHSYDFVKQDIQLWWPKLKRGGILCGHDYLAFDWYLDPNFTDNGKDKWIYDSNGNFMGIFGVNPAVDEFCEEKKLNGFLSTEWFGSFFIKKIK